MSEAEFEQYLGHLRHDLRTPAGHIIGYAEMIAEDLEEEGLAETLAALGEIKALGDDLLETIDEQFGAGKKESADIDCEGGRRVVTNLARRVRAQVDALGSACGDDQQREIGPDLAKIHSATDRIEEVLAAGLAAVKSSMSLTTGPGADSAAALPADSPAVAKIMDGGEILIVDDNGANLDLLKRRIARDGYRALAASSGEEALELLRSEHIDLVLLDLVMPDMDGLDVLRLLQEDSALKSIPVIMLSALDDMDQIVQCILEGAEDYLMKPVNPVLLKARISASLEKHRLRQQHARRLKVFISSPSDVTPERQIVRDVIRNLNAEFAGKAHLIPVLWEEEPLLASETAQTQIELPRETDIYVGIFWARFGTPLPKGVCRPDGSRYLSGSEFEFEDAMAGYEEQRQPDILVYKKTAEPLISLTDREAVLQSLDQKEQLERFIRRWFTTSDGLSIAGVYHPFESEVEFRDLVEGHLRKLTQRHLSKSPAS